MFFYYDGGDYVALDMRLSNLSVEINELLSDFWHNLVYIYVVFINQDYNFWLSSMNPTPVKNNDGILEDVHSVVLFSEKKKKKIACIAWH